MAVAGLVCNLIALLIFLIMRSFSVRLFSRYSVNEDMHQRPIAVVPGLRRQVPNRNSN